jgi:hypothetical protein
MGLQLLEQLRYMHHLNVNWMHFLLEDVPEIDPSLQKIISKIINANHIRICELLQMEPLCERDDWQAQKDWLALENENFLHLSNYFQDTENGVNDQQAESIIRHDQFLCFHMIKENAYYIGQLQWVCKQLGLEILEEYFRLLQ